MKSDFTIKDLENISGIKAHTIRIWEKRYGLLAPKRSAGNIRYYSSENLRKLLNIVLLYNHKYKISKIANLSDDEILLLAREFVVSESAVNHDAINAFKLAMFTFDKYLFNNAYHQLLLTKTVREIFKDVFIPFLNHIGLLWQTKTLTPAHEHFITNLIAQKIHINIEKSQFQKANDSNKTYVLYLPENEIHELGLLYLNYELSLRGYSVVYLGQSVPVENLEQVLNTFDEICFISYFTIYPAEDKIDDYIKTIKKYIMGTPHSFWCVGKKTGAIDKTVFSDKFQFFDCTLGLLEKI